VNRKLVTKLLQKRGHDVEAVENGRAALDAIESVSSSFDVVLMDLQMPEMGGFEATAAIRDRERTVPGHLPVIALTAHAMGGDRERCLAAGMDGYLSKPIEVNDLVATVERLGGGAVATTDQPAPARPMLFDEEAALKYAGGDRKLLKQVILLFRSDARLSLQRMKRALQGREAEALRMAAHGLKGAIATVGSAAGRDATAAIETLARSNKFEDAERAYGELRSLLGQLDDAFMAAGFLRRADARRATSRARRPRSKRSRS
jgi:CheY-like chemotaxis protein